MNFHILTLFPEMVMGGLNTSITGRAIDKGLISVEAVNIRDYSKDKHHHVDDAPYGGGAGMVMQPEPIYDAYEDLAARTGKRPREKHEIPGCRKTSARDLSDSAGAGFQPENRGRTGERRGSGVPLRAL